MLGICTLRTVWRESLLIQPFCDNPSIGKVFLFLEDILKTVWRILESNLILRMPEGGI